MPDPAVDNAAPPRGLDQIETDWAMVHEPAHVVMRYARAIQSYFHALIHNHHDAEEVAQDFFLWVSQDGLPRLSKDRGRFRDYLKIVVRNAAMNFLRRQQGNALSQPDLSHIPAPEESPDGSDQEWLGEWRRCLLKRTWRRLRELEKKSRSQVMYKVLRISTDHPELTSEVLAQKLSEVIQKNVRPDAFRQQLSRARRYFAQYLVDEVALTLTEPEPSDVEDELVALGVIDHVREFLPLRRRIATS